MMSHSVDRHSMLYCGCKLTIAEEASTDELEHTTRHSTRTRPRLNVRSHPMRSVKPMAFSTIHAG